MAKRSLGRLFKNIDRAGEVFECMKNTPQWLSITLAYLGIKELQYPFLFKTRRGQKITINSFHDLITVWVIFCRHEYKIPADAKVVVDAGANIGTFSIYASARNVEEIYAIEPFPETFSQLQENIAINGLQNKIELKSLALANESGERDMDVNSGPSQSRGLLQKADQNHGLKVSTLTLSDFLKSIKKDQVDLLKIDIEGGEHEVFHSSEDETIQKFKYIAMEYHPNASKTELFERLKRANFQLTHDFNISSESGVAYFSRKAS